jgi:hypothetical protein
MVSLSLLRFSGKGFPRCELGALKRLCTPQRIGFMCKGLGIQAKMFAEPAPLG